MERGDRSHQNEAIVVQGVCEGNGEEKQEGPAYRITTVPAFLP